jgi:hypothetical protein
MGLGKDIVACLAKCAFRFKINCKGKCCESNCMLEEGSSSDVHPSPVLTVKNMPIHEEKASAHISTL